MWAGLSRRVKQWIEVPPTGDRRGSARAAQTRRRLLGCEPLEDRTLFSVTLNTNLSDPLVANPAVTAASVGLPNATGVVVTPTQIITSDSTVPRFTANPTTIALRSGSWSDPTVWSNGTIPAADDQVSIPAGLTLTYSQVSDAAIGSLEISGKLTFATDVNTRLTVGTVTVMPGGTLEIGTTTTPVASGIKAELVIADQPLNLTLDPEQFGTGLLVYGTINIHGAPLNQTWVQLAGDLHAGNVTLTLAQSVTGWQPGQTIIVPDTRQVASTQAYGYSTGMLPPNWEEATIASVSGNTVILTRPLQYDHLGGRNMDGTVASNGYIAVLDRNVVIRSANPSGTRGHTYYTASASVDIEYAQFLSLGRSDAFQPFDNTQFDAAGNVTHIGTNQMCVDAVDFESLFGPANPTDTGYQFKFVGNTIDDFRRWGLVLSESSYGLVTNNVIYNGQGAGLLTKDGNETLNNISSNFAMRIMGTGVDGSAGTVNGDIGRGGVGFWFRRTGNQVDRNVATDAFYAGYVITSYNEIGTVNVPNRRGYNPELPGFRTTVTNNVPGSFMSDVAFGWSGTALWGAYMTGNNTPASPTFTISAFTSWNIGGQNAAITMYHTSNTVFQGLTLLGSVAAADRPDTGPTGMTLNGNYENVNLQILGSRIEGFRLGIAAPVSNGLNPSTAQATVIQDSVLTNYINVRVQPTTDRGGGGGGNWLILRNDKFQTPTTVANTQTYYGKPLSIQMLYLNSYNGANLDVVQPSVVQVYNYNQVSGANFQVYYKEQAPNFVLPPTSTAALASRNDYTIGAPTAGLTNSLAWSRYGMAMGGAVSPTSDSTTHPEIAGFTGSLVTSPTPRVMLFTPWNNATVTINDALGEMLRIRYSINAPLTAGTTVFFSLDGQAAFSTFNDGGLWNVSNGRHTLRAYIGNSTTGAKVSGSFETTVTFSVIHV